MSLNFNGNYIGGIPSGGGGGGTITVDSALSDSSENPVQNKVINTALGGKQATIDANNKLSVSLVDGGLNADASNLTTDGQKVFDGQWVESKSQLFAAYIDCPTSTADEYDLSSYLPDDNYNYEVMVSGVTRSSTTVGQSLRIELASDIFPAILFSDCACVASGQTNQGSGSIIIPVGTGRKVKVMPLSWAQGTYKLWIIGYRRIGTNQ